MTYEMVTCDDSITNEVVSYILTEICQRRFFGKLKVVPDTENCWDLITTDGKDTRICGVNRTRSNLTFNSQCELIGKWVAMVCVNEVSLSVGGYITHSDLPFSEKYLGIKYRYPTFYIYVINVNENIRFQEKLYRQAIKSTYKMYSKKFPELCAINFTVEQSK